ncbi:MAG: hypothetical protein HY766_02500 [candidate division NC10 bacterium]|nr:hypothetical protein [candidate division NC10 bacterium]
MSGNPYGVFLVNESDRSWRWVPWSGAPLIFPDRNPAEAWDYVALDATRFLNVRTGQLHRLAPGLPPDLEAAPFPPGGTRWDAYHILGR